jgi:hypothetical protein
MGSNNTSKHHWIQSFQNRTENQWIVNLTVETFEVCYRKNITGSRGLWRAENALVNSLPQFVLQLFLIILIIRIIAFVLKPLRQPRIVAEILVSAYMLYVVIYN